MSAIKGDFIGFEYDGIHSSDLEIVRVSDGSRYSENLFPTIQDKTTQIPGADGTYFFGSYFTQKQISFSFAYNNLSEEGIRKIKSLFGDKKIHNLIFDETPYKIYKVKTTGSPNLKYICFSNPEEAVAQDLHTKQDLYGIDAAKPFGRIYKGEGQASFITYLPFAVSRYKYLDQYTPQTIPQWESTDSVYYNLPEWQEASRMVNSTESKSKNGITYIIDTVDFLQDNTTYSSPGNILIHNAGDIATSFKLYIYFQNGKFNGCVLGSSSDEHFGKITIQDFSLEGEDNGICINSKLNLIEGVKYIFNGNEVTNIIPTGMIYNKYIEEGDFFKIQPTDEPILMPFSVTGLSSDSNEWIGSIEYNYYYL